MNSVLVVFLSGLVACASAGGGDPTPATEVGEPVCDVSEQLDFQKCMTRTLEFPPFLFQRKPVKDNDAVLGFLSSLARCHLGPLGMLRQPNLEEGAETPTTGLDDSLSFLICYNQCYNDWADGMLRYGPAAVCFKSEFVDLTLCFYQCVRGDFPQQGPTPGPPGPPPGITKRQAEEADRKIKGIPSRVLLKVDYILCYVNCYEKDESHDILESSGFVDGSNAKCRARDTVIAGQCGGECLNDAFNRRKKRATDSKTTEDRLLTVECEAKCIKNTRALCLLDEVLSLKRCVERCLETEYRARPAPPLIPQ